jgi:hypothetical protein
MPFSKQEDVPMTTTQPGWYDEPENANAQRYWDGQQWTPHRQRKPASAASQPPVPAAVAPSSPLPSAPPPGTFTSPPPSGTPERPSPSAKGVPILAGLGLLLAIAALVVGRVLLGNFLPGLLLVAVVAVIGITVAVRSGRSVARKAVAVGAMVVVVAVAVPASLKVVYPVYHHFFKDGSPPASAASPGSPSSRSSTARSSTSAASPPAGAGQFNVVVDGRNIDVAAGCTTDSCRDSLAVSCTDPARNNEGENTFDINVSSRNVGISSDGSSVSATLSAKTPAQLLGIFIGDLSTAGAPKYWSTVAYHTPVTTSGKTYTMTGDITPIDHPPLPNNEHSDPIGPAVPFEFTATCP